MLNTKKLHNLFNLLKNSIANRDANHNINIDSEYLFRTRIKNGDIKNAISAYLLDNQDFVIITDSFSVKQAIGGTYKVFLASLNNYEDFNPSMANHFIYACENSDIGVKIIKKIINARKKFYPVAVGGNEPTNFLDEDSIAKSVLKELYLEQKEEGFNKFGYGPGADFINICQFIERTSHLSGVFLEVGAFRGSSGQVAVKYMNKKKIFRKCIFIDVFEGFNYESAKESSDAIWLNTHKTEGQEIVSERLAKYSLPSKGLVVEVRKGNIIESSCLDDVKEIAIANIDVDLYEAVLAALNKIFPKVVRGGVIIVEDPGHSPLLIGARVALDDFLKQLNKDSYFLVQMESGQFIIIKQ